MSIDTIVDFDFNFDFDFSDKSSLDAEFRIQYQEKVNV